MNIYIEINHSYIILLNDIHVSAILQIEIRKSKTLCIKFDYNYLLKFFIKMY